MDPVRLFEASNRVERSLISVMADETTYNLHIIVRFQMEQALIDGDLSVEDAEGAWNARYSEIVGVQATKATDGILQDVHWSSGAFGYFPSYSLGNLYSASMGAKMEVDLPDLWTQVEAGQFDQILAWLRKNIHHRGHMADAPILVGQAVGDRDHVADLTAHLRSRLGAAYKL